jgi:hypothetical protein
LFFLDTWAPWLTRTYLSFAHTLDFVFAVLSAQHPFVVQGFTNGMDMNMIRHQDIGVYRSLSENCVLTPIFLRRLKIRVKSVKSGSENSFR